MTEKLFPTRKRCKKCSKKLDAIVLDGVYCSYECGHFAIPFKNIQDAPRQCKMERNSEWVWKQKYRSISEVPKHLQNDPSSNIYTCSHCHFLHVGHSRPLTKEPNRLVNDQKTLSETLVKMRELRKLTRKQVADKINVRPIRIKEIEENNETINMTVLFKLLKFYKMKMSVTL